MKPFLNKGIINSPPITNFSKFVQSCRKFLNIEGDIEHIGSMFTVRTVLANHDHDDARPSLVKKHLDNIFSIYSGKISTAVNTANQIKISIFRG